MKKIFLLVGLICVCVYNAKSIFPMPPRSVNSQNFPVADSGSIRILYAFNAVNIKDPKTYDDLHRLDIGSKISRYYSHFLYNSDSLITEWKRKRPGTESAPTWMGEFGKISYWSEHRYSEYMKDWENRMLTEYSRSPIGVKTNYFSKEDLLVQEWQIDSDTLTVLNYLCQKATCNFRGRNYTAWFNVDIPISDGPWKFTGLPGLILKVYDDDKLFNFECIGIEKYEQDFPIRIPNNNYIELNRTKLLKWHKDLNEDYMKMIGLRNNNLPSKEQSNYQSIELN